MESEIRENLENKVSHRTNFYLCAHISKYVFLMVSGLPGLVGLNGAKGGRGEPGQVRSLFMNKTSIIFRFE